METKNPVYADWIMGVCYNCFVGCPMQSAKGRDVSRIAGPTFTYILPQAVNSYITGYPYLNRNPIPYPHTQCSVCLLKPYHQREQPAR